jgi:nitrogen fixation NifU-like protein
MNVMDLYQQLIVDHGRRPRNFGACEHATCQRNGHNPLCGDQLTVAVRCDGELIKDMKFTGEGCAISMASASLMTEALLGKTRQQAMQLFDQFHQLLTDDHAAVDDLGKLSAFAGVRAYPMRVKCATLAWHTMKALWDESATDVQTEAAS